MKKIFFLLLLIAATFCFFEQGDTLVPVNSGKSPVFKTFSELRAVPANQLDTGTIYFRNTARVFVPYKWNPASTAPDDSASVIRTGKATGRFELYYEDYIMVDWF